MSVTPTLRDEPLDVDEPLEEKPPSNSRPKPDARPEKDPARDSRETEAVEDSSGDRKEDVLIVDWDGPSDPANPKK